MLFQNKSLNLLVRIYLQHRSIDSALLTHHKTTICLIWSSICSAAQATEIRYARWFIHRQQRPFMNMV